MSIDERLMQPGRWRIDLKPETPLAVQTGIVWRDHIVVTPARLTRPTYTQVRNAAIYAGVVLERSRRGPDAKPTFGGLNLLYWLGDASRGFAGVTTGSRSATITTLLNEIWSDPTYCGDFTLTLSSVPATTVIDVIDSNYFDETVMKMIDRWRRKTNPTTEFAMRHTGEVVFSQAGAGSAFVQTPKITVTRDDVMIVGGGRHLVADAIVEEADAFDEDYEIDMKATDLLSSGTAVNSDYSGRGAYNLSGYHPNNRRVFTSTSDVSGAGAAQDFACAYLATSMIRKQRRRLSITLPAGSIIPNVDLAVGDYIYLYDPWTGAVDTTNKVLAAGTEIHPQKVRVTGVDWGIPEGAGVYWLKTQSGNGTATDSANAVDLSDLVEDRGRQIRLMIDTAEPVRAPAFRSSKLS